MVIAIDGPAGAGKSTAAKGAAARLGFAHLDTGAMYRAVALVAIEQGITFGESARSVVIDPGPPFLVNGVDPGGALRSPEVTSAASEAAGDPEVREALISLQRRILERGDWVAEGRDICTVVAPDAEVRIWLTASEELRAQRRALQTGESPEVVLAAQRERDAMDQGHGRSTTEAPAGAVVLDTSGLSADQVIERIVEMAAAA